MGAPPGEATRDRILRLADSLFARHGYARVSMRMVATAAGVTKPALYYHFRDKEALFEECVLAMQAQLRDRLTEAASSSRPLGERVRAVALVLLTGTPHHPIRVQNDIAEHLPAETRERLGQGFYASVLGPITDVFAAPARNGGLRDGITPAVAGASLLGLAMAFWPAPFDTDRPVARPHVGGTPDIAPEQAADVVADVVLRGVVVGA